MISSFHSHTEEQLLHLLREGSQKAFTEIYERNWEILFAISYHYCGSKEAAEEIVQEVFLRLWDKRDIVEIYHLGAYLATACKFGVFKQIAKEKRRKQLLVSNSLYDQQYSTQDESFIEAKFLEEYIHGIIEQLPEQCKIVYKLRKEQELSVFEIATQLNISPNTARNQIAKARKVIRRSLKQANSWLLFFF
ncbi:RNA polymerase sigma factor [Arachidicoccus sp.]|uniref:RNA polymerase sigma factor n=1 Tax=Arachidicoccus sp. TaxID=1872624 RepID=UPI003D1A5A2C